MAVSCYFEDRKPRKTSAIQGNREAEIKNDSLNKSSIV